MPEREKNVIQAIYIQGHSYEEAAQQLGIPFGTLKRLQTQGLKLLRQKMQISSAKNVSDSAAPADLSHRPTDINPQPDSG